MKDSTSKNVIIIFISSNYLFVSGEHRAHYNTNVCSRFCCTIHPFQAFGYPSLLPYMRGSVFILVIRRGVCANAAVYFKATNPMTLSHRFLVSLHIHDTTYSFRISPCPLCSLLWISGFWHSTEIDSRRCLLRLLIINRPDTPTFWQVNNWRVLGPFVPCFFLGSPDYLIPPLALCFQVLMLRLWSQPDKQRKLFIEEKVRFPMSSPISYVSYFPLGNLC